MSGSMRYIRRLQFLRLKHLVLRNQTLTSAFSNPANRPLLARYCSKKSEADSGGEDFFGFSLLEEEKSEVNSTNKPLANDEIYEKYRFCDDTSSRVFNELKYDGKPKVIEVPYGSIRYDTRPIEKKGHGKVKTIGNDKNRMETVTSHSEDSGREYHDEILNDRSVTGSSNSVNKQYFIKFENYGIHSKQQGMRKSKRPDSNPTDRIHPEVISTANESLNFIDEQYFDNIETDSVSVSKNNIEEFHHISKLHSGKSNKYLDSKVTSDSSSLNFIDEHYFENLETDSGAIKNNEELQHKSNEKKFDKYVEVVNHIFDDKDICVQEENKTSDNNLLNFVDEQYFPITNQESKPLSVDVGDNMKTTTDLLNDKHTSNWEPKITSETEIVRTEDKQVTSLDADAIPDEQIETGGENIQKEICDMNDNVKFIDNQYFHESDKDLQNVESQIVGSKKSNRFNKSLTMSKKMSVSERKLRKRLDGQQVEQINVPQTDTRKQELNRYNLSHEKNPQKEFNEQKTNSANKQVINPVFDSTERFRTSFVKDHSRIKPDLKNPKTAYDVAMKIRTEKSDTKSQQPKRVDGKLVDSQGFRILKDQVDDLSRLTRSEVTDILYNNIIYDRDDVLAINKPYGLPSQDGPGVHLSVAQLLEPLAKKLNEDKLQIIHRLDKETTGVMLLAKTSVMAELLRGAFKRREVQKCYWTITKGIPNPPIGRIVIPMMEGIIDGKRRMALRPNDSEDIRLVMKKSSMETYEAVTDYKVIDSNYQSALVECRPETGVKHQIRVHLAWGLNTPVLGDHKYSHYDKLAPQKLPVEMLHRLRIQQTKVRYVPMHLHAMSILIPEFREGRNLFVSCKLPPHFVENMKRLKLKTPKK